MANKVKSLVHFLDNYEWVNMISALIMLAVSIALFINYQVMTFELIIVVGLMAILKGFLDFNICLSLDLASSKKKNPTSFILGALFNLLIGVILILNIITSPAVLLFVLTLWMIVDSVPYILYIFKHKLGSTTKYNPFIFTYGLILVTAISQISTSQIEFFGPVITVAIFLSLSSINLLLLKKEGKAF